MSRAFSVALLALLAGAVAIGQNVSMQPGRRPTPQPQQEQPKLSIDEKLMYICKQLDLDEKQWQHADGLFEIFESNKNPSREEMLERLQEIQRVYQEKEAAKAAGETERAEELNQKLRSLAPGAAAETEFLDSLRQALSDAQKAKLEMLLTKLNNGAEVAITPVGVIRAARAYDLSAEQKAQLGKLQSEFRAVIKDVAPGDAGAEKAALDKLINDVANVLDEAKRESFRKDINKQRTDTPRWEKLKAPGADNAEGGAGG